MSVMRPNVQLACGLASRARCSDGAKSGLCSGTRIAKQSTLFDHLVGAGQQRWRNSEAERSHGLQFSLGQKLRMIALHKSQQPVATLLQESRCLLFMTDIFGCDRAWLRQSTRF